MKNVLKWIVGALMMALLMGVTQAKDGDDDSGGTSSGSSSGSSGSSSGSNDSAEDVSFTGAINSLPSGGTQGVWVIRSQNVTVNANTLLKFEGQSPAVGQTVEVEGAGTPFVAKKIELRSGTGTGATGTPPAGTLDSFTGSVTAMSVTGLGTWTVSGRSVVVDANTAIDTERGAAGVGATVEVKGTQRGDGTLLATRIEVKVGSATGGVTTPGTIPHELEVFGKIESQNGTTWVIAGVTVSVPAGTPIDTEHGAAVVGAFAEVHFAMQSGTRVATRIETKASSPTAPSTVVATGTARIEGIVTARPSGSLLGAWTINGRTIIVDASTKIERAGTLGNGLRAQVSGFPQADGSLLATKIEGGASAGAVAATVVEFTIAAEDRFFITADASEAAMIRSGAVGPWTETGKSFSIKGGTSVCRFFGTPGVGPNSHFFTASELECEAIAKDMAGWQLEGFGFFVVLPQTDGTCPSGTKPVYRAYNNRASENKSNHRFTTDLATYQAMTARGWSGEGVVFCAQN